MTPTEKLEAELEKKLAKEYRKARRELGKKLKSHLSEFKEKDAWYKEQLGKGSIHQDTYKEWREEQLQKSSWVRDMRDTIAKDLYHVNKIANDMANEYNVYTFCEAVNYETYKFEHDSCIGTSFSLYSKNTVGALLKDNPSIAPRVLNPKKDMKWNKQKVTSALVQSTLQGEAVPQIAKRLQGVVNMNEAESMRAARTMMGSANHAGKQEAIDRAIKAGIPVEKGWLATLDLRTRHSHRAMDMQFVKGDEKFSNGMMFPGDWSASIPNIGAEIYNCRCDMITRVAGIPFDAVGRDDKLGGMSYEDWKNYTKDRSGTISNEELLKKVKKLTVKYGEVGNLIPLSSEKIIQESARSYNQAKEVSDKLSDYKAEEIDIKKLETRQTWLDYEKLEDMANYDKLDELLSIDAMEKIRAIRYKGHIILIDGNHRVNLMKLKGYKKIRLLIRNV